MATESETSTDRKSALETFRVQTGAAERQCWTKGQTPRPALESSITSEKTVFKVTGDQGVGIFAGQPGFSYSNNLKFV